MKRTSQQECSPHACCHRVSFVSVQIMSLSRLALVELQLCLHGLDLQSMLSVARCCRFTLAAVSTAFAWKHIPTPTVFSLQPNLAEHVSRSVLRFAADLHFRWLPPLHAKSSSDNYQSVPQKLLDRDV